MTFYIFIISFSSSYNHTKLPFSLWKKMILCFYAQYDIIIIQVYYKMNLNIYRRQLQCIEPVW